MLYLYVCKHHDLFDKSYIDVQPPIKKMHNKNNDWINNKDPNIKKHTNKESKKQVQTNIGRWKESWWSVKTFKLREARDKKDPRAFNEDHTIEYSVLERREYQQFFRQMVKALLPTRR